ncbi:N1221-domain-containing protein [Diplogelasinospora grovesii]|uniref:N1221-domain-containing protein n=1 Tax=Diplogelasinospora grovesii TaxID=303347 RepID=A0AAN6N1Z8_9PEZI|nr:N1221-domain-containing protein [Diplogelasinospora grovesii]
MNSLWPSRASSSGSSSAEGNKPAAAAAEAVDDNNEIADIGPDTSSSSTSSSAENKPAGVGTRAAVVGGTGTLTRPLLVRNQTPGAPPAPMPPSMFAARPEHMTPAPPIQSTPQNAASNNGGGNGQPSQPGDSLSLAQLRRIVAEFPRTEPIAYDYVYTDMGPIEEEIDEWFMYNFWQWVRLNSANRAFHSMWGSMFGQDTAWEVVGEEARKRLVRKALLGMQSTTNRTTRSESIGTLVYLVLGRWTETVRTATLPSVKDTKVKTAATKVQLDAMKAGVQLLADCDGIAPVWDALRAAFEPFWVDEVQQNLQVAAEELIHLMTIVYISIQETLEDPDGMESVRSQLVALNPSLVHFFLHATAKLRWDESCVLPQTQVFLLFWKSILLVFGGSKEIADTRKATSETPEDDGKEKKDVITASPLDYHVFRQEITSKYPAYIPPQPAIPLEPEQTSLLPQSPNPARNNANGIILSGPPGQQSGGASILHQPVHIATPAPSPPPSPGVGGKGGKKQNYQTNQNFPFMYPPLDATSNSAGGKGGAGLQDLLVGRKWEGSDVPASILEAGELFSNRVRMTRSTRQLWDERERFLKFDRGNGWDASNDDIIDELDLSGLTLEEKEELGLNKPASSSDNSKHHPGEEAEVDYGPRQVDQRTKERLRAVEDFYKEAVPHLQSLVIVLLKAIVAIASNLMMAAPNGVQQQQQGPGQQQQQNGPAAARPNGVGVAQQQNGIGKGGVNDLQSPSDNDVDEARSREIAAKAVTGIMILLLKWFKLSHVLKFEYLTQLLLDSNYIPLVLKLFALHDIQQVVESKPDRIEQSFFYFCGSRAGAIPNSNLPNNHNPTEFDMTEDSDEEDEDSSIPPPIKRRRSPPSQQPTTTNDSLSTPLPPSLPPVRPEVDELGYPLNDLPKEPITEFSRRNFFSLINYLRVMQKICKHKAHRNLLLVHYKSSNILRKSLKVPQQELRLYTLKLFKNQVPYCGRKWRQSNMRVITAVYLHCRPELRDGWLAGADIDADVEEALPLEQALRSLTHWFNVRRYPDKMAADYLTADLLREEHDDFFVRELDKIEWVVDMENLQTGGGPGGGGPGGGGGGNGCDDASVRLEWEHDGY